MLTPPPDPPAPPTINCYDIFEEAGFTDVTGRVAAAELVGPVQASFLAWYNYIADGMASQCPAALDPSTGTLDMTRVITEVMVACSKAISSSTDVWYAVRFTAYYPCNASESRYTVLEAVVRTPSPSSLGTSEVVDSTSPLGGDDIGWGVDVGDSPALAEGARVRPCGFEPEFHTPT